MTDYYKTSLEILHYLLSDNDYDFWANWMLEDIRLWETEKSVEHHLNAYGGMGSFNDVVLDCLDNEEVWKDDILKHTQYFAHGLAKGENAIELAENGLSSLNSISGWKCRNCRNTKITPDNIEYYVCHTFVPKFFLEFFKKDRLKDILLVKKLVNSDEVQQKREYIKKLIINSNITFSEDTTWNYTCPYCQSKEVCYFRWEIGDDKLIEAEGNLEMI